MKIIRLTEDKLYDIIKNSVTRILKENEQSEINDIYNSKNVIGMENNNPLLDKNWGNGFSLRQFVNIRNISDRIDYCYETLKPIGEGQRRACFLLNDKYVLKITTGSHRYQSKNEYDSTLLFNNGIDLFPRIYYQSPDFTWSIVEYARPMTEQDCQNILGLPLFGLNPNTPSVEGFQLWAETKARQPKTQLKKKPYKYYASQKNNCDTIYNKLAKEHPWFKQLYKLEISQRNDLEHGTDLTDGCGGIQEALGIVKRNGKDTIVIRDIGFIKPFDTRKIKRKYGIDSPQVPEIDF